MSRVRTAPGRLLIAGMGLTLALAAPVACRQRQVALAVSGALEPAESSEPRPAAPGPERLEAYLTAVDSSVRDELQEFYAAREFAPAWFDGWRPRAGLSAALDLLRDADGHGLDGARYGADALTRELDRVVAGDPPPGGSLLAVDVGVSEALLRYAREQVRGRVGPDEVDVAWHLDPRTAEPVAALAGAVQADDPAAALDRLEPPHAGYVALREGLERYRGLAARGGWEELPEGAILRPGDAAPAERLRALARRLRAEGYDASPPTGEGESATYGAALEQALRRFQEDHGIAVDGVLGPNTLRELNVSAAERVEQIRLNLDRWRWLPGDLGSPHMAVNVPAFELRVLEDGREALQMRVVVGRDGWGTPFFSEQLELVVFNPYWNVPDSIARAEIIPQMRRDPGYAERHGYTVLAGWSQDAPAVDPYDVDWSTDGASYRFRRAPGASNPLGRMKFLFPDSRFNIYLHDTPADHVFDQAERADSHGCVRVERPYELADYVLGDWDRSRIEQAVASGRNRYVRVDDPLPVHLVYFTAEVRDGRVRFYPDVYEVDAAHARALERERS